MVTCGSGIYLRNGICMHFVVGGGGIKDVDDDYNLNRYSFI